MENDFTGLIGDTDPLLASGGLLVVLALLVTLYVLHRKKPPADERHIEKIISGLSEDYVRDVIISDGMYGYQFIDYLILLPRKILVLGVQRYEGHIFGAENIEEWAQVVDKKSYKFENPLHYYQVCSQTLNGLVDGLNVQARVVFTSESNFPKGVPEGVLQMSDFDSELEKLGGEKSDANPLEKQWHELLETSNQHKVEYIKEKGQ